MIGPRSTWWSSSGPSRGSRMSGSAVALDQWRTGPICLDRWADGPIVAPARVLPASPTGGGRLGSHDRFEDHRVAPAGSATWRSAGGAGSMAHRSHQPGSVGHRSDDRGSNDPRPDDQRRVSRVVIGPRSPGGHLRVRHATIGSITIFLREPPGDGGEADGAGSFAQFDLRPDRDLGPAVRLVRLNARCGRVARSNHVAIDQMDRRIVVGSCTGVLMSDPAVASIAASDRRPAPALVGRQQPYLGIEHLVGCHGFSTT